VFRLNRLTFPSPSPPHRYVESGSLGQTLKEFGTQDEQLVSSYTAKVLGCLAYLHKSNVIHCRLKAANVLTTKSGNVKLSDFGISLSIAELMDLKRGVAETLHWSTFVLLATTLVLVDQIYACLTSAFYHVAAPEVIRHNVHLPASDIWSLACIAIELLTGHPPYYEIHDRGTGV
jgi:serine/threonine protein kinase